MQITQENNLKLLQIHNSLYFADLIKLKVQPS